MAEEWDSILEYQSKNTNFKRRLILLALAHAYLGAIENISNRLSESICCQDDVDKLRQLYIEATKFKAVFLFHQPVVMRNISFD